jgi:hypothetical protein
MNAPHHDTTASNVDGEYVPFWSGSGLIAVPTASLSTSATRSAR